MSENQIGMCVVIRLTSSVKRGVEAVDHRENKGKQRWYFKIFCGKRMSNTLLAL